MSQETHARSRILIFVVAYDAERHLRSVFDRIPPALFDDERIEFVCIDDASSDRGPEILAEWLDSRGIANVSVFRNPSNQGYGGNQKLGYRLAIDRDFDFVILLHGDGQYAPELLPDIIETWERTGADVVLGSRMLEPRRAREGGMPLYKWLGNRVLTRFQNALTGLELSEYHSGYRGYSTAFLGKVPFEIDTNDFHFDTEILLQAAYVGARIVETSIPTHYGDEICHVPGLRYAWDVFLSTTRYKLHQMGMLCSLKYRHLRADRYADKTDMLYSSHAVAIETVKRSRPRRILDIGCGAGFFARRCEGMGIEVTGIDAEEPTSATMSAFHRADLEDDPLPIDPFDFDAVFLLDVIEHLADPELFLVGLRNRSQALRSDEDAPLVVVSTPNVAFVAVRLNVLLGRFPYAERGILDITHKRLFTRGTFLRTLRDCGYQIDRIVPIPVPFEAVIGGRIGRVLERASHILARLWPQLFAFQFLVECRPRPGVAQILSRSEPRRPAPRRLATQASARTNPVAIETAIPTRNESGR